MYFRITKIIIFLCLLVNCTNSAIANIYDSIEYNLNLSNIKNLVLKVEIILKGKFEDKLILNLPYQWAGQNYIDQIKNIQVDSKFQIDLKQEDNNPQAIIIVPKTSNNSVKVTYEIHHQPKNPSDVHGVIIRDDLVHAIGYGIFATPFDLNETDKIKVNINWVNLNRKWKILSSYSDKTNINLDVTASELLHAIYIAGKTRLYNIGTNSRPIILSLYGNFDIKDQKIKSDLKEIINSQRRFFNDFDFPYYAISLIEGNDPKSMGGTSLFNSFTAFLPKGMHKNDYYILFAHEHLHNWIGGKIRNNEDEELNYWWTEGFTDFYARLISLRSKSLGRNSFINEINQFLNRYYLSLVNEESNSRIKKDFWNNYDIEKLPYYRGFIFALYLNNLIKKENPDNSLDNIMHDLFKIANEQQFSSDLFKKIAKKYIKNGIENEMTNFIDQGKIISLENINLPIEKILRGKYYLGFDKDILVKYRLIKNIDIKTNAYKAGLRNGDKIISYDFPKGMGESDQITTIETRTETFKFKPEDYNKLEIYQLKKDLSQQEIRKFNEFFGVK